LPVTGAAVLARQAVPIGPALDVHRVEAALVALERPISGRVAVLAAGTLEHRPDRLERGDGLGGCRRSCGSRGGGRGHVAGGVRAGQNGGAERREENRPEGRTHDQASSKGRRRSLFPVRAKTALPTAGAIGGVPGSPMPPILAWLFTM